MKRLWITKETIGGHKVFCLQSEINSCICAYPDLTKVQDEIKRLEKLGYKGPVTNGTSD